MLYLLRHGQTDWNTEPARCQGWADVPLNDVGRQQARAEGRRLADRGVRLVVTSHLLRARQTAELARDELVAAAAAGPSAHEDPEALVPIIVDERLAETRRGDWEGRTFTDIVRDDPEGWRRYRERPETFRFPGGESLLEQQRRVLAGLRDVAAQRRVALLVTHGGSIRLIRAFVEGRGLADYHHLRLENGDVLALPCTGLVERVQGFLAEQSQEESR